jgi:hypothetical protein
MIEVDETPIPQRPRRPSAKDSLIGGRLAATRDDEIAMASAATRSESRCRSSCDPHSPRPALLYVRVDSDPAPPEPELPGLALKGEHRGGGPLHRMLQAR